MSDNNAFAVERYKAVLDQKKALNDNTFKIASIYQVIILAVIVGQYQIISNYFAKSFNLEATIVASWILFFTTCAVTLVSAGMLIGGVFTWVQCRIEESVIETTQFGSARKLPGLKNVFKWYETYLIILILLAPIGYGYCLVNLVFPILK